ncbi:hypothetical protein [Actinomadura sp. WMMA1423]|uniref:hypothetical protein n=1 Tax=Actinomadura sp. WMMA1423 TaxID=2591108 RepID=UPI0011470D86|nr:hypothetical protein [Actinomadura sp. WMMA1423]
MLKATLTALAHTLSPARRAIRPERLQALTDEELADLFQRWNRRSFVADAVLREADRRDKVDEKARQKATRQARRRAKEAGLRDAYQDWVHSQYLLAEEYTRGNLLNRVGKAAGVDPYSLFSGQWSRARKYASEELVAFWGEHGRITFAEFKRRSREQAPEQAAA